LSATGVRIAGVGHYLPERILTNADLERTLDTSDEWISSRTGIRERRMAREDEATSDLAVAAARNCLERSKLNASDIDLYIVATCSPDMPFPATGCIVVSKLGVVGKPAFDMEIACSGFVYGLTIASSLVRAGVYNRVMLIGAEKLSAIVNYEDRGTAILFGDGAGAVILERAEVDCFLASDLGSDGTTPGFLMVPGGGTVEPMSQDLLDIHRDKIHMNGTGVFKVAVNKMAESAATVLRRANLTAADCDFMIPHQANRRIIDSVANILALPAEKVIINVEQYGNTSAASIPIALSETELAGKLKAGDIIVFAAFGGGLSWGAVAWKWAA